MSQSVDAGKIRLGHVLMTVVTVLVATSFPVGAAITNGLDPVVLTFLRFVLAAVLFAPIVAWRYGLTVPGLRDLARYSVLSVCLVGFFWGMFAALRHTSALNTATIFTLLPLVTALVAAVLLRERLAPASRLALPVGAVGAVWVIVRGDVNTLISLDFGRGDAIFLAATLVMGFYGPLVKRLHRDEPMAQMTFWTLVTGAFWLLLLSAPRFSMVDWGQVPLGVYAGIVYLAVFTTLVTFFVIQWSSLVIGPTKTVSYTYFNPILVLVMGLALGEGLPVLATYPGFLLIFAAIYILLRAKPGA
ncbi:DMT family transporter [Pseudomonadota bacterium]